MDEICSTTSAFDQSVADWDVSKVSGSGNFQGFNLMFRSSAFINDDCKKQLTYASFSQQTAAFDLTYGSWSSAARREHQHRSAADEGK